MSRCRDGARPALVLSHPVEQLSARVPLDPVPVGEHCLRSVLLDGPTPGNLTEAQ